MKAGEFVVERVLHTSERGRVYLAKARDGRKVALKELVFAVVPDAATVDAFLREGRMLETLVHPGIPRSIASFREGDGPATRLYLAQEYVAGDALDKELETRRYDEQDVRVIAREVLGILVYLHGLSPMVVHRDVKPANLVRREDGSIALVDFDAARDVRPGGTHRATLVGTFGYMPLEQVGGSVDDTADLYALGATLLHLLARRAPHELLTTEYEFDLDPTVNASPAFKAWLGKLVARHARDRFQSAREALDALAPPRIAPARTGLHAGTHACADASVGPAGLRRGGRVHLRRRRTAPDGCPSRARRPVCARRLRGRRSDDLVRVHQAVIEVGFGSRERLALAGSCATPSRRGRVDPSRVGGPHAGTFVSVVCQPGAPSRDRSRAADEAIKGRQPGCEQLLRALAEVIVQRHELLLERVLAAYFGLLPALAAAIVMCLPV